MVAERLGRLADVDEEGRAKALALVAAELDPKELLAARLRQKAYLARYARQDMLGWGQRDVRELKECFDAVAAIVAEENELTRAREDG